MNANEFKQRLQELPLTNSSSSIWNNHGKKLRYHAKREKVEDFLRWSTIQATMFVGNNKATEARFRALPEWIHAYIKDSGVGNPQMYNDFTSGNYILQAYQYNLFENADFSGMNNPESIAEFGGGYGSMATILKRYLKCQHYYIYDIPEFLLLQEYYTSKNNIGGIQFRDKHDKLHVDLVMSICAMSEVPVAVRDSFLKNVTGSYYFIIYQPKFIGIDNDKYFKDWADKNLSDYNVITDELLPHKILVGER